MAKGIPFAGSNIIRDTFLQAREHRNIALREKRFAHAVLQG